jgi:ficolin
MMLRLWGLLCVCVFAVEWTSAQNASTYDLENDHENDHENDVEVSVESCTHDIELLKQDVKKILQLLQAGITNTKTNTESGSEVNNGTCTVHQHPKAMSCQEIYNQGRHTNGLATIFFASAPDNIPVTVCCDQTTKQGGWILFLRHADKSERFPTRSWNDYSFGFGNPTDFSYFLGLETAHQLTRDREAVLRIELEDFGGEVRYAEYAFFRIDSRDRGYRLYIDDYSGDAGDSLQYHNGQVFSTQDRDLSFGQCAKKFNGAWWYRECMMSCLTGEYMNGQHDTLPYHGIYWKTWKGPHYSYKRAEMKFRLMQ